MTRVLCLGLAGMDWPTFQAMTATGALPSLAAARANGQAGWLRGAPTGPGPAAWASLVTGRHPEAHGVWRDEEAWAAGTRPVSSRAWRAAPLWSRLSASGVDAGVVAWPASRPGAGGEALVIDEDFSEACGASAETWPMPPSCAPPWARAELRGRRVHPTDITADMLAGFVPDLNRLDQSRDANLPMLAVALARAATIQGAAAWILERPSPPPAIFIRQPWLDDIRGVFHGRRPDQFSGVIPAAWRFLDGLFGVLDQAAGPAITVMVVSPGWEHRPGVILVRGPDVARRTEILGVDVLDIAPTLLALFGLDAETLPGRVVETIARPAARAPAADPPPAPPCNIDLGLLRQAAAAGFAAPPEPSAGWRAQGLAELAVLLLPRSARAAAEAAQAALAMDANNLLAHRIRATAAFALEEEEPLALAADAFDRLAPDRAWGNLARAAGHVLGGRRSAASALLRRCEADSDPEVLLLVAEAWRRLSRHADAERALKTILARNPDHVAAEIGLALTEISTSKMLAAEARLRRVLAADPSRAAVRLRLAWIFRRTGRDEEAQAMAAAARRLGADDGEIARALA